MDRHSWALFACGHWWSGSQRQSLLSGGGGGAGDWKQKELEAGEMVLRKLREKETKVKDPESQRE